MESINASTFTSPDTYPMPSFFVEKIRYYQKIGRPDKVLYEKEFDNFNEAKRKAQELKRPQRDNLSDGTLYWEKIRVGEVNKFGDVIDYPYEILTDDY